MKYLKSFVDELPRGHPLGLCRELHKPDVWFNRLLMALKFKDASGERLDIAEIRVALEMHKFFSAVDVNDLDRQVRHNANHLKPHNLHKESTTNGNHDTQLGFLETVSAADDVIALCRCCAGAAAFVQAAG